jgi:hypothetical protein
VIWATGYRDDSHWVHIPQAADETGSFVESRASAVRTCPAIVGTSEPLPFPPVVDALRNAIAVL